MSVASPQKKKTELAIGGMTCASCVARVRSSLARVPGVSGARVNLATERATVEHDSSVAAPELVAAVESSGYQASPIDAGGPLVLDTDARGRERAIARKRRLLLFGACLFAPSLALGMWPAHFPAKDWIMLALALPAWAVVGYEFHRGALAQLRHGAANMDTLVSLGSTAALAYSIYATFAMRPAYYETAVAIVVLIYIGKYLETVARGKTNLAIRKLLELRPSIALVVQADGSTARVRVETVRIGDVVIARPGDRIPVDGVVIAGSSTVDMSMVTGESVPREVAPDAGVVGGTVNIDGVLHVRATAVGEGTVLARIVRAVQDAQGSQAPVQRVADAAASVFVPVILLVAALTFAGWVFVGRGWAEALVAAVAVIVVACPCAMGLATPTAVMVGVGAGARRGILFKNAEVMERAGGVTTVVFDKTGTLTRGTPSVVSVLPAPDARASDVVSIAAAAEASSSHPFALAVVDAAREAGLTVPVATLGRAYRGSGISARVDGSDVIVGTDRLMTEHGISVAGLTGGVADGATRIYVARHGALVGALDIADRLREEAIAAVASLRALGLRVAVVSGDAHGPVHGVATALGISNAHAESLPEEKAAYVAQLRAKGERVAFVGDGINDAPALAAADVGIAMGSGAAIALEAAQTAIISNDPRAVAGAIVLSRATMRTIRQNLFWAFAYNVVLVPLAAAGLVHPIFAAAAMGLSSVFVVGNSLLLGRRA